MLRRESNELGKPGMTVPFRNLFAILLTRVKNKDRASPHMSALEVTIIRLDLGEYFQRSQPSNTIRDSIEQPNGMLNRKRPETDVV